jgi:beta-1,4-N-acetylglucosaminyltransferase
MRNVTICLVASLGGHLKQMRLLRDAYKDYKHFIIIPRVGSLEKTVTDFKEKYTISNVSEGQWRKKPWRILTSFFQALLIMAKKRPDYIICTGAGIAVPAFLAGKILGIKRIYVEVGARIKSLSLGGRICYPLSDLFFIQHRELLEKYPRAQFNGTLYKNLV